MKKLLFSNHRFKKEGSGRSLANFCWQVKDSSTSSIAYCLWTNLILRILNGNHMLYEIRRDNDDCKPWHPGCSSFTGMVMWGCRAGTSLHERRFLLGTAQDTALRERGAGRGRAGIGRGGHRHLQIGRMLDIDLISEPPPPTPPPPRCMYPKCGNLCV
jgi:hypothetical protein